MLPYPHADQPRHPGSLRRQLLAVGKDPAREALEALAIEGYRTRQLSENQVRILLGFATSKEVHALLQEHNVYLNYSMEDLEQDIQASNRVPVAGAAHGDPSK